MINVSAVCIANEEQRLNSMFHLQDKQWQIIPQCDPLHPPLSMQNTVKIMFISRFCVDITAVGLRSSCLRDFRSIHWPEWGLKTTKGIFGRNQAHTITLWHKASEKWNIRHRFIFCLFHEKLVHRTAMKSENLSVCDWIISSCWIFRAQNLSKFLNFSNEILDNWSRQGKIY